MLRHLFDPYIFVATVHGQILGKSGQIRANQGKSGQWIPIFWFNKTIQGHFTILKGPVDTFTTFKGTSRHIYSF